MHKILITGATGFLGSKILIRLVNEGYKVVALVRKQSDLSRIKTVVNEVELFCLDRNTSNLNELFEKTNIDMIIHTATEYGRESLNSDVLMTNLILPIKLIETGLKYGLKNFINSDTFFAKPKFSNAVYLNQYSSSKKYFLDYLFSQRESLKSVSLRLEHVFGEFDSDNKFVTNVLQRLLKSDLEISLTDALQKRDFIYIDDVVEAYFIVLKNINFIDTFSEFEVGRGNSISVREFVELMAEESKSKSKLKFGFLPTRAGEIQDSIANISPLNEIGWYPSCDLRSGLKKMIELEKKIKKYL